jgi:inorganic pyrophosphatase
MGEELARLEAIDSKSGELLVVVDTPRGSAVKFKYDEELRVFTIARFLPSGLVFPFDFGFVPGTRAEDGDALDVVLLMEGLSFPGCVVRARLLGVLEAKQKKRGRMVRDDRLIAVASKSLAYRRVRRLHDLERETLDGIERFFAASNQVEGRRFEARGRFGLARARATLERSLLNSGARRHRKRRSRS